MHVQNIAAYKFARLEGLKGLRARLGTLCRGWGLRGTILLSTEGINLFVAGEAPQIGLLLAELRSIPGLAGLEPKISPSETQPFNRMLVRIKKEIIAFGVPGIDPARHTSPKLPAKVLKAWLDEGRPVTLLDTRNNYEIRLGTFQNALAIGIDHFREFPGAVPRLPASLKEGPIVTFCTGGIRCEKAAPCLEQAGFKNVFQLEGGILKYFEECGGAHYQGECFVFDQRVGVDPSLRETSSTQCFQCLTPLTAEEQRDPRSVPGVSCPYCHRAPAEKMALAIARRHETIRRLTTPLPGSTPVDDFRPVTVPRECDGFRLLDFLAATLPHVPRERWEELCEAGRIFNPAKQPAPGGTPVRAGERYCQKLPANIEPEINPRLEILHEDEALIVLNKPAPLPLHPGGRFNRNTLQHILQAAYHPEKPRPAHRLDANTTGLLLVTRTRHFASKLQPQFARGEIRKTYLVRVQGSPPASAFSCDLPIGDAPGPAGTREPNPETGLPARTDFRVLRRDPDRTTLLEANPVTGRTNQIRAHLWALGHPVCGDPTYPAGEAVVARQTLSPDDPPLCLHAWKLEFTHPLTGERVSFTAPPPAYFCWENAPTAVV